MKMLPMSENSRPTSFFIEDILLSKGPKGTIPLHAATAAAAAASRELQQQSAAAVQAALQQHVVSSGAPSSTNGGGPLTSLPLTIPRLPQALPGLTPSAAAEYGLAYLPTSAFLPHQPLAAHPAFLHKPLDPFLLHPGAAAGECFDLYILAYLPVFTCGAIC